MKKIKLLKILFTLMLLSLPGFTLKNAQAANSNSICVFRRRAAAKAEQELKKYFSHKKADSAPKTQFTLECRELLDRETGSRTSTFKVITAIAPTVECQDTMPVPLKSDNKIVPLSVAKRCANFFCYNYSQSHALESSNQVATCSELSDDYQEFTPNITCANGTLPTGNALIPTDINAAEEQSTNMEEQFSILEKMRNL